MTITYDNIQNHPSALFLEIIKTSLAIFVPAVELTDITNQKRLLFAGRKMLSYIISVLVQGKLFEGVISAYLLSKTKLTFLSDLLS